MSNRIKSLVLLLGYAVSTYSVAYAQEKADTLQTRTDDIETFHSVSTQDPNQSALYSAAWPGLGQAYNKQYWKLPIVYSGAIVLGYFIQYNDGLYNEFRNAYLAETDGDPSTSNPLKRFSKAGLQLNAERFKRDRDYAIIIAIAFYLLQVVDAHVSAHLLDFNLSDDLSIRPIYQPQTRYLAQHTGLSLAFRF